MGDNEVVKPDEVLASPAERASGVLVKRDDTQLAAFLSSAGNTESIDPEQAQLDIIRRILAAVDAEAVLQQQQAIHARDVVGLPLTILGFDYNESTFEEGGLSFYMLINCVNDEGEPYKITCGAVNVMAQLYRLGQLEAFPIKATIVEAGKPSKRGYKPMWLEAVPAPF